MPPPSGMGDGKPLPRILGYSPPPNPVPVSREVQGASTDSDILLQPLSRSFKLSGTRFKGGKAWIQASFLAV